MLPKETIDFDAEGRALLARLNLELNARNNVGLWNPMDPIWRHPTGGGTIYVGNEKAAASLSLLNSCEITRVVNCTSGFRKIPDFYVGELRYFNFDISNWTSIVDNSDESMLQFVRPLFQFIEDAVSRGYSVLVHCLAGAHRAGTTGIACLIHFAGMDVAAAVRAAKICRPIIDPIGRFPDFLKRLYQAEAAARLRQVCSP